MVRLSLNISESDKYRMDFDSRARLDNRPNLPLTSIGRINTDKNLHSKMEEYQAKIYRY
jgi:chromosome segregation ATPase